MKSYMWVGIAAVLTALPAPCQIIQRMERDVLAATKAEQQLEKGPLLGLAELEQIAVFSRFSRELRSEENGILRRAALRLSQGDYALARKEWELALTKMKEREFEPDIPALVHGVLQEAYLEKDENLRDLAAAVVFRKRQQEAAYSERARMERRKAAFDEGTASGDLRFAPLVLADKYQRGVRPVETAEPVAATAESVSSELQKIVVLCDKADENAEQSVVDLQKALEGQVLQTMSNASKMLHDTAKAIVSNAKA